MTRPQLLRWGGRADHPRVGMGRQQWCRGAVCVLDSGVDGDHPDVGGLTDRVLISAQEDAEAVGVPVVVGDFRAGCEWARDSVRERDPSVGAGV
jgi:hypothetical protein